MQKKIILPKDAAIGPAGPGTSDADLDVEGHGLPAGPDDLAPRLPSSGGELSPRLPSTGGDLTDDEATGHGAR